MAEEIPAAPPATTRVLHEIALALSRERALEPVLDRIVAAARELTDARYAAIGIPDGLGGFAKFVHHGMSPTAVRALGPLPRVHGLLAATLQRTTPERTDDITADPRFQGWPAAHPAMRAFLGVPVTNQGEVIAAIYCTERADGRPFTAADQSAIELLAAHAGVAIDNARLWERSRELALTDQRATLARALHDAMSQRLFSLSLTADAAARTLPHDPEAARDRLAAVQQLIAEVQGELRALITQLRPADLSTDGLAAALDQHVALLGHATGVPVRAELAAVTLDATRARQLELLAQEALHNALRHARAAAVRVRLAEAGEVIRLEVTDDGVGFDPSDPNLRAPHLGLASMRERARAAGGRLRVDSAPGRGTTVVAEVPRG